MSPGRAHSITPVFLEVITVFPSEREVRWR